MINFEDYYNKKFIEFLTYANKRISKIDVAKDITQEAFINFHKKMANISPDKYDHWLKVVIKNKTIDYYRSNYRNKQVMMVDYSYDYSIDDLESNSSNILDKMLDIEGATATKKEYNRIIEMTEKLSPAYKSAFIMFELENKTHKEIARHLEISVGASKSNVSRAKAKLKELLSNT